MGQWESGGATVAWSRVGEWLRARLRGDRPASGGRSLPHGVDEVRRLQGPEAEALCQAAGLLASVEQAAVALEMLAARRKSGPRARLTEDAVADLALLRFGVVQFTSCFARQRGSARLTPRQAFGDAGGRFFVHIRALAEQLEGAHARVVGETEAVVLVVRQGERLAASGVVTRSRRPDRLTSVELDQMAAFMRRGVDAYARQLGELRAVRSEEVRAMDVEALRRLPLAEG